MPAPVERPDDVHHRPDRRDDDADVLRKPGPPHLRRPRDPAPQTARRGRRNEVEWDRRSVCVVFQQPPVLTKLDRPQTAMVCPTLITPASPSARRPIPENPTGTRQLPARRAALAGWPAGSPTSRRTAT